MHMYTKPIMAAALLGAAFLTPPAAHAAPTTIAVEQAPTRVAAWESTVMWSRRDPATGRYALMKSVAGGAPEAVGVPPRPGRPFDVDLGTSRSGSTVAVYTRDGDIYRLDVASGRESKVARLSSPKVERSPTIQDGAIAFIRRAGGRDELRAGTATAGSRVLVRNGSILHAELGDRHVAYVTSGSDDGVIGESQMHIRNLATGSDKMVYRARSGGSNNATNFRASYMAKPQGFVWARTNVGASGGSVLVRYRLAGSRLDFAAGSSHHISTAWAGAQLGVVSTSVFGGSESINSLTPSVCTDTGVNYCSVVASGPLSFSAGAASGGEATLRSSRDIG